MQTPPRIARCSLLKKTTVGAAERKKGRGRMLLKRLVYDYFASTTFAIGAFFLTDSMPLAQASLEAYASLTAMISPLAAFNLNLNFPFASLYHSNTGSGIRSPELNIAQLSL
jgi:hypothetical protein